MRRNRKHLPAPLPEPAAPEPIRYALGRVPVEQLQPGTQLAKDGQPGPFVNQVLPMGLRGRMTRVDTTDGNLFLDTGEVVEIVQRLPSSE